MLLLSEESRKRMVNSSGQLEWTFVVPYERMHALLLIQCMTAHFNGSLEAWANHFSILLKCLVWDSTQWDIRAVTMHNNVGLLFFLHYKAQRHNHVCLYAMHTFFCSQWNNFQWQNWPGTSLSILDVSHSFKVSEPCKLPWHAFVITATWICHPLARGIHCFLHASLAV